MNYIDGYPKTINEQIADYTTLEKGIFTIKDSDNTAIIEGAKVLEYLECTYNCYKSQMPLHVLWGVYENTHHNDFLKAYAAVIANYDPLENYNGTETTVRQKMDGEQTETITHGKTTTNSLGVNGVETTNQVTSVDSATLRDESKTTQKGTTTVSDSGTTTTTKDTDTKSLTIGDTTYTADYVEGETKSRHGNLGVTSSQNMIQQEIDLRLKPLLMLYLDEFAQTYLYYVGGEWCDSYIL